MRKNDVIQLIILGIVIYLGFRLISATLRGEPIIYNPTPTLQSPAIIQPIQPIQPVLETPAIAVIELPTNTPTAIPTEIPVRLPRHDVTPGGQIGSHAGRTDHRTP